MLGTKHGFKYAEMVGRETRDNYRKLAVGYTYPEYSLQPNIDNLKDILKPFSRVKIDKYLICNINSDKKILAIRTTETGKVQLLKMFFEPQYICGFEVLTDLAVEDNTKVIEYLKQNLPKALQC